MPSYIVTCSCGRRALIQWDGFQYFSTSPGWDSWNPAGWNCGREGHTQRVPPQRETKAQPKLIDVVL